MLLQKFALVSQFCQQSFQHCFNFMQSDPIEQSSQVEFPKNYQAANSHEISDDRVEIKVTKPPLPGKLREDEIPMNQKQLQEESNPFTEFKQQLNFRAGNSNKQDIEKVPLRYQDDDIDTSEAKGWHDDDEIVL